MAVSATELHVLPHATTGGWTLGPTWFATLTEAEQAAKRVARAQGARVFLHDRYHRVRALTQR